MATEIAVPRASELLARMAGRRVVVVGDVMIDEWIWGRVSRISPEAPVPVVAVQDHSFTLGGSGNVANNLRALGAAVTFVGAVGNDAEGERVRALFAQIDCDTAGLVTLDDRPTTRKTRIVAHNQQVVRADWESTAPLRPADRAQVVAAVRRAVDGADAVVLSDYAKGLLHRDVVVVEEGEQEAGFVQHGTVAVAALRMDAEGLQLRLFPCFEVHARKDRLR